LELGGVIGIGHDNWLEVFIELSEDNKISSACTLLYNNDNSLPLNKSDIIPYKMKICMRADFIEKDNNKQGLNR
jgi:hypothetical protein